MTQKRADISQLAYIVLWRLKVCQGVIWCGIMLLLLVSFSAVFSGLCLSGLSPFVLNILAWSGLIGITGGCAYGFYRSSRDDRLFSLMKANLLRLYPEQRKDFDAWLATELYAPDGEATWKLINRRLQEQIPPGKPGKLIEFPRKPLWFLIPGMIAVISIAFPGKPQEWTQLYFRRLILGHDSRPLQLVSIKPDHRWVVENETLDLELLFDREVEGDVVVTCDSTDKHFVLDRDSSRFFKVSLPPQSVDFNFSIRAEDLKTDRIKYKVVPMQPLKLDTIALLDNDGELSRVILPRDLPAKVPDGSMLRFVISVSNGPWETFGLGSRRHGEIPLNAIGHRGDYQGEMTLFKNDSFFLFWQLPGRAIEQSPGIRIECLPNLLPSPVIESPDDGIVIKQGQTTVPVIYSGSDDDGIASSWLWVTDYYDMFHKIEVPLEEEQQKSVKGVFNLVLDQIPRYQGRILGCCLIMRDTSRKRQLGASKPINLLLPGGDLNPENREKMRLFWEKSLARKTRKPKDAAVRKLSKDTDDQFDPMTKNEQEKPTDKKDKETSDPKAAQKETHSDKNGGAKSDSKAKSGDNKKQGDSGRKEVQTSKKQAADSAKKKECPDCANKKTSSCSSCNKDGDGTPKGQAKSKNNSKGAGQPKPGKGKGTGKSDGGKRDGSRENGQSKRQTNQKGIKKPSDKENATGSKPGGSVSEGVAKKPTDPNDLAQKDVTRNDDSVTSGADPDKSYSSEEIRGISAGTKKIGKDDDPSQKPLDISNKPTRSTDNTRSDDPAAETEPKKTRKESKELRSSLANEELSSAEDKKAKATKTREEYQRIIKKLTPEERRKLREYYRHLRDAK